MNLTRNFNSVALAIAGVLFFTGCASTGSANSKKSSASQYAVRSVEHGKASWYSIRTNRGTRTASGARLCDKGATAAHKTLPMGTKVRVTNQSNGKSEIVTITDRGPYIRGRPLAEKVNRSRAFFPNPAHSSFPLRAVFTHHALCRRAEKA
jgi:rare lipoprotein A